MLTTHLSSHASVEVVKVVCKATEDESAWVIEVGEKTKAYIVDQLEGKRDAPLNRVSSSACIRESNRM